VNYALNFGVIKRFLKSTEQQVGRDGFIKPNIDATFEALSLIDARLLAGITIRAVK
jgi:hypothetical protein